MTNPPSAQALLPSCHQSALDDLDHAIWYVGVLFTAGVIDPNKTFYMTSEFNEVLQAAKSYRAQISITDELENALRLTLPMAKGYAHANNVGSNSKYIEVAEAALENYSAYAAQSDANYSLRLKDLGCSEQEIQSHAASMKGEV